MHTKFKQKSFVTKNTYLGKLVQGGGNNFKQCNEVHSGRQCSVKCITLLYKSCWRRRTVHRRRVAITTVTIRTVNNSGDRHKSSLKPLLWAVNILRKSPQLTYEEMQWKLVEWQCMGERTCSAAGSPSDVVRERALRLKSLFPTKKENLWDPRLWEWLLQL